MASNLLPSGQWNQGTGPPFRFQVGHIEKAVGCLRLIVVGFFASIFTCCISCGGIVMLMKDRDPIEIFGVTAFVFLVVLWIVSMVTRWRFKKAYGKTAVLDVHELILNENSPDESQVIPYNNVNSISIKKARSHQLGYELELADRTVFDLDPDLAMFPKANYPIEQTVLPVVIQHWDRVLFQNHGSFVVATDATRAQLRGACAFWIAVGTPLVFLPNWWGTMLDFFRRAQTLYQQSKYCGEPFVIDANGISIPNLSHEQVPLSDIRLAKRDDIAIVLESRSTGKTFMAPITARNAYTAGHWLFKNIREGAFQNQSIDPQVDQRYGRGLTGLESELF